VARRLEEDEVMAFTSQQMSDHRAKLRAKGICTRCHKRKVIKGLFLCLECRKQLKDRRDKVRAEGGRCNTCENLLDEFSVMQGHTYCPYCLERRRIYKLRSNA